MNKIRLKLDALAVESFQTDAAPSPAGTVHGAAATTPESPCIPETFFTCPRRRTEYNSCVANCECTNGLRACIGMPGVE